VWEVGCGHGHFLTAYAKAHPGETCIGIDITSDRIVRADRKRSRARLENLHFVRADADDFLVVMPESARFTAIFILFPDPWPKRRHHKNRVVKAEFLSAAAARAQKGTDLYFRTDHEPYFREVSSLVNSHRDWSEQTGREWRFDEPTVFEKRAARYFSLVAKRR
jgi:tRNA (guanine-N7-)-methyltransferase